MICIATTRILESGGKYQLGLSLSGIVDGVSVVSAVAAGGRDGCTLGIELAGESFGPRIRGRPRRRDFERDFDTHASNPQYGTDLAILSSMGVNRVRAALHRILFEHQNGVCAICKQEETSTFRGTVRQLALDHNHNTQEIRGLLCGRCNRVLGMVKEDPQVLRGRLDYIARYN